MRTMDKARFSGLLRPLSAEDAREIVGFVLEDIDLFLLQLSEVEETKVGARGALFHKIRGFAAQFFLLECEKIAECMVVAASVARPINAAPLRQALIRARDMVTEVASEVAPA